MARSRYSLDEFEFNEDVIDKILKEGTEKLLEGAKNNSRQMFSENRGRMTSGRYAQGDVSSAAYIKEINTVKKEGVITFKGTISHGHWGKPVRAAEVAFINEYGAPGRRFPARPFMLKSCVELDIDGFIDKYLDDLVE